MATTTLLLCFCKLQAVHSKQTVHYNRDLEAPIPEIKFLYQQTPKLPADKRYKYCFLLRQADFSGLLATVFSKDGYS